MKLEEMRVDELFVEATRRGLRLNNLFQRTDGTWQANFRTANESNEFGGFGHGKTASDALIRGMRDVEPIVAEKARATTPKIDQVSSTRRDIEDLL